MVWKEETALSVRSEAWQQRNASRERAQLCVGVEAGVKGQMNYEPLDTMTSVHQMGVCSDLHRGHWGENETFPRLVLMSCNEGRHHNKCHLAFCGSGCCGRNDESPTSAFNRALLSSSLELTVTQSRTLSGTLGFHADTECTSHG